MLKKEESVLQMLRYRQSYRIHRLPRSSLQLKAMQAALLLASVVRTDSSSLRCSILLLGLVAIHLLQLP